MNNLNLIISILYALLALFFVIKGDNLELALFNALMCTLYARWHTVDQREVNVIVKGSDIGVTIYKSRRKR